MPVDAAFTRALLCELKPRLEGAKIDKIQQPERDVLLLSMRGVGGSFKLLVSCVCGSARMHITQRTMENPAEPPMFCMLLRKHLTGARIASVTQPNNERMLVLELDSRDELGYEQRKKLVVEMMGRSSNIILVGTDGRIIDCVHRMDIGGSILRCMQPGMLYRLPPVQSKIPFFDCDAAQYDAFAADLPEGETDRAVLNVFSGLSPLICRELCYRAEKTSLARELHALRELADAGEFTPVILYENGSPRDFSFLPIEQYGSALLSETCTDFSALLDSFYSKREQAEHIRRRTHELTHTVKTLRDRTARKLAGQSEELKKTDERENVRIMAELVTANIYRLRKGDRQLQCENYYESELPTVTIPLDPLKTPQQNAASLYKQYNKLKNAREHLTVLIEQGRGQLEYLDSVLDELDRAENERDISEIRRELTETGLLRQNIKSKPERIKPQGALRFVSSDGLEILVGRSNTQNDELTTKLARRTDYWLHTQRVHGSHVIIRCDGIEPPEATVLEAASLAAYYSQGRDAGKIPVDCTMVRNVRKPSGAMPGKVIYTDYTTIYAQADAELVAKLKK